MLFWSANWIPLTISGISGTIARTVTPIKYWRIKCADVSMTEGNNQLETAQKLVLTWEMLGWFSMGWMFSVTRSAQADVSTVAMIRMTKDLHLDQWTTAPWWPVTAWTRSEISVLSCNKAGCDPILATNYDFQDGDTCLVPLQHECHKCGSASSVWMSDQWCKRLARGQTPCTPVAWQRKHSRTRGKENKLGSSGNVRLNLHCFMSFNFRGNWTLALRIGENCWLCWKLTCSP